MIHVEVVREKVRRLLDTADALRRVLPESADALAVDRDRRDLVAFRVYLVMQEAVDLAAHLIAEEGFGPAPSLREHFTIVAERGVVDVALAQQLAAGVKVRNVIAHGYVKVDPVKLLAAAALLPEFVRAFCGAILAYAESRAGG